MKSVNEKKGFGWFKVKTENFSRFFKFFEISEVRSKVFGIGSLVHCSTSKMFLFKLYTNLTQFVE